MHGVKRTHNFQIPLGALLKNENKGDEMKDIL